MPKNKLSKDVIDSWPEILEDIDIQVVPIEYLDSIRVSFVDGKIWDIDITKSIETGVDFDIEDALEEIFDEYQDTISGVDFRLDTEKVKRDIKNRTAQFLKKRK